MKLEYLHASKFGSGELGAARFERQMAVKGADVELLSLKRLVEATR